MMAPTTPNRIVQWTGTFNASGDHGGPAWDDSSSDLNPTNIPAYSWKTLPETFVEEGISVKTYQNMADKYTDNPVESFETYRSIFESKDVSISCV